MPYNNPLHERLVTQWASTGATLFPPRIGECADDVRREERLMLMGSRRVPYALDVLDPASIDAIHEATLEVLSETGALFEDEEVLELLDSAGASVDDEHQVRVPPSLVEQAIESAPSSVSFFTRDGEEAMRLEPGYVYFGTGSDCPDVLDPETGVRRKAVKRDIETFARLSDALPGIDFILSMGLASDVPSSTADVHHFHAMVCNTTKPVLFTAVRDENLPHILDLAAEIVGSQDTLAERPFVGLYAMPSPPLRHSKVALRNLVRCARRSIPVVYASGTNPGATGPMSIAGSTVSANCDVLAGLVVHQLASPGAPYVYGVGVLPMDMRSAVSSYGAPEHHLGDLVNGQVAQSYRLPTWGFAAAGDSKVLDLQAGLEYCSSATMGLLSQVNMLHDVGFLDFGRLASCESIVFADEVIAFCRSTLQPVAVDRETLGVETIKKVGPGGTFLTEPYTVEHFREFYDSSLIDRRRHEQWVAKGSKTMMDRLHERARDLLASHRPSALDPTVVKHMDSLIAELESAAP
jgi:trimethylamine--corrinoid protein Co-methyltransferase